MKKVLLTIISILLFLPFVVKADSCDVNKVKIDSITLEDSEGNASEKNRASVDENGINLDLNMFDVGDSITYKMVIRNDTEENLELTEESFNISSSSYIKYSLDNGDSVLVRAKSTKDVLLKVEYENEVPSNLIENGSYKEEKDLTIGLSTLTNPKTGDRMLILILIMLGLSVIGYILIRKEAKSTLLSIILMVLLIPSIIYAECSIEFNIKSKVEISKIAIFDTGYVVNSKLFYLADGDNIYEFVRSNTLPDDFEGLVEEELDEVNYVSVTNEEVNNEFNRLVSLAFEYNNLRRVEEDGIIYLCYGSNDSEYCGKENDYSIYAINYNYIIRYDNSDDKYMVLNKKENRIDFLSENEFKNKIREDLLFEKKNEVTQNILSSDDSDYIIYGWFDDGTIYYYCEKEDVYLNENSSFMFTNLYNLESASGIENVNTSIVKNMDYMFFEAGYNSNTFGLDLSHWNTSNVESLVGMFANRVYEGGNPKATTISLNVNSWDTSRVKDMNHLFYNFGNSANTFELDVSNWSTSNVTDMSYLFSGAGYNATRWRIGNISSWDTSKVKDMNSMLLSAGYGDSTWTIGDLSGWDVSNVVDMGYLLSNAGYNAESFVLNLSSWNVSKVRKMNSMLSGSGKSASLWSVGDISNWDVSNVTNMNYMFSGASSNSESSILDLNKWTVSNVTNMSEMFSYFGENSNVAKLYISNWNVSKVKSMSGMFESTGRNAQTIEMNLSNWNTSSVIDMKELFENTGSDATTWNIGDISGWNVSNVTNMDSMFANVCFNVSSCFIGDLSNWDTRKVEGMSSMFAIKINGKTNNINFGSLKVYADWLTCMFSDNPGIKGTLNIYKNPSAYVQMFRNAATEDESSIIVNYTSDVANIDDLIATKSSNSHVTKGELLD